MTFLHRCLCSVLMFAVVMVIGCGVPLASLTEEEKSQKLVSGIKALESGDQAKASSALQTLVEQPPADPDALLQAGQLARQLQQPEKSILFYNVLAKQSDEKDAFGRCMIADTMMYDLGQSAEAEQQFRDVLTDYPQDGMANEGLGHLLQVQGRVEESVPFLIRAVRNGRASIRNLIILGWTQVPAENRPALELNLSTNPNDANALLGLARIERYHNRNQQALEAVRQSVDLNPSNLAALGLLGKLLLVTDRFNDFLDWYHALPKHAKTNADVQYAIGLWAEQAGQYEAAARAFQLCVIDNPDHGDAVFRLANMLVRLDRKTLADNYFDRAAKLEAFSLRLGKLHDNGAQNNPEWMTEAAQMAEQLGRIDEAAGWYELAVQFDQSNRFAMQKLLELKPKVKSLPRRRTSRPPTFLRPKFEYAAAEVPRKSQQMALTAKIETDPATVPEIHFSDQAETSGISFSYFSAADTKTSGFRMYESMGGGGGAIDFDRDGFPDIYFTQGSQWPPGTSQQYLDRLYRNVDGQSFVDATINSGLIEPGFSQGVACGDMNGDGFMDVYVANIGPNRLFLNNGDGTFSEIEHAFDNETAAWTASAAMADLSGDGLPEIYDVNYLQGADVFTRACLGQGASHNCRPALFEPAQDQLFSSPGTLPLQNTTATSGIQMTDGNGLGIVVADLDGQPGNDIFVANDFVPNFLFVNQSSENNSGEDRPNIKFAEQAIPSGLAFDRNGRYQACMGVAFDDVDANGLCDLFVTNFSDESNTLYSQIEPGLFSDETRPVGLREPSFEYVGFGTQFLDADLDSEPDLFLTNGGLSASSTVNGGSPELPAQFFWNDRGTFTEMMSDQVGAFFEERRLGRGAFSLDWNRDGRDDLGVSFLDRPVALLTNDSPQRGNFISITLVGRQAERIPHGSTVTVTSELGKRVRQLSAGDGYMSSNNKELIFGIGDAVSCEEIAIRWPNGQTQKVVSIPSGSRIMIVEGVEGHLVLER